MEYLVDCGLHTTVPLNFLKEALQREYQHCFNEGGNGGCLRRDQAEALS